jgi:hypothetical protein
MLAVAASRGNNPPIELFSILGELGSGLASATGVNFNRQLCFEKFAGKSRNQLLKFSPQIFLKVTC